MINLHPTKCCGVGEIENLSHARTPEEALLQLIQPLQYGHYGSRALRPFITFTGVTTRVREDHTLSGRNDDYGQAFADFLTANGLGKVISSDERPGITGNGIKIWVWYPEYNKVWEWYKNYKG